MVQKTSEFWQQEQCVRKTSVTSCADEIKNKLLLFNCKLLWRVFPTGDECGWSPAGVATVQPSSPQPAGSPLWMSSLSRWGEVSTTSAHRGAVLTLKGEGESKEASTVVKKKKWLLSGTDASPLLCVWSAALLVREEQKVCSLLGPEVIPKVRREGNLLHHWGVLLGEGGRRTGGRS